MKARPVLMIEPNEKLRLLRMLDTKRPWQFLDDRRRCRCCGKYFSGRQIQILTSVRSQELPGLECPTRNCVSTPADWLYLHETPGRVGQAPFKLPIVAQVKRPKRIHPQMGLPVTPKGTRLPDWLLRVKRGLDPMHHFGTG